ncbi:5-keto-4-deoxy-D-glucarate aldolase [Clostridium homopropionicum DSM 5847]|uniref:5-keto-4-deoxy-D-glucarate aldolase n=1 Tax=Clostridium homopropionicum DSM 5847 TaxID=1121318 RepID=A0A0L6Z9S5_9CLOT|nr:aldolase/citrate lyase family protein [Clostridium homopropionicum]KOA19719.1 5-keto-4-deoxy-D-glucarate aldolase [Clostridium homopropionicum DSM 5847]SFF79146.1 2-dehydro-3-deoxyglucarate aldolase [Clostridium homopropionicum]
MAKSFFDSNIMNKLRRREPVSAAWAQMGSNISAEILAEAGFDILVIDMEHAPLDLPSLVSIIQATKGTDCAPFVRLPWNDMVWSKQVLDAGAYGVHVPYVSTKEEAEYAVKSCKYAPEGFRGIAGSQRAVNFSMNKLDYYSRANQDTIVMVAIETPEGVENIEDIVSVPGVDGIFIGPSDLSTAMGYLANPAVAEVQEAIKKIETATKASGKFLGTIAPNVEVAKKFYEKGYSVIYFMSDATELANQAVKAVQHFKTNIADGK